MKIYPSRTGETTSLIHYPLVSCLQGNTQKRNTAFFCPSQRFTQMPLGQIKQTGVKPKWFTVPQSGVLWGWVYRYTWERWRQDNKTRPEAALQFPELHTYYLSDLNPSCKKSQYGHEEAHGIFKFPNSVPTDTSNLPLILHTRSDSLSGHWLLLPWWHRAVGAAAFGSRRAVAALCRLALGSPAGDVCIPGRGLAGSDQARLGRRWSSASKDEWRTHAWRRTLLAVPCQPGRVPLGLATLFHLALAQSGRLLRLSQLGSNHQLRGSWRNGLLASFISGYWSSHVAHWV